MVLREPMLALRRKSKPFQQFKPFKPFKPQY
jgi:hypothetical protein